jgi:hypothetical protein
MNERSTILLSTISVVVIALAGGYFWLTVQKPGVPTRPGSVPARATWIGWNKGEWIDCAALSQTGRFRCDVYADVSGDRLSTGEYALDRSSSAAGPQMMLTSFDGQMIETNVGKLLPYGSHTYFGGGKDSWTKDFGPPRPQG